MSSQNTSTIIDKKSIRTLYELYCSDTNNLNDLDKIFYQLSEKILSKSPSDIGYLLVLLNKNVNTNVETNVFRRFFDQYASYLSSHSDKNRSVDVLKRLLSTIRKLTERQHILTTFIWENVGFRELIAYYPKSENGFTAMTDSIFCTVTTKDALITNMNETVDSFEPLIQNIQSQYAVIDHIDSILTLNKEYTFDDPAMINGAVLSSTDFCVMCLNILIKIIKVQTNKVQTHDNKDIRQKFGDIFWKAIDVVYVTVYVMSDRIQIALTNAKHKLEMLALNEFVNAADIAMTTKHVKKGEEMLNRLYKYMDSMDIEYLDTNIPEMIDHVITTKKFNVLTRLITSFGIRSLKTFRVDRVKIAEMILKLLKSRDVPVHNKFFVMRLVISHGLKQQLLSLQDSELIITRYIIDDVLKLKEMGKMHIIDILLEFHNTSIGTSKDILELYLYMTSEFNEMYTDILKMLMNLTDEGVLNAMRDLVNVSEMTDILLKNMPLMGRHSMSYLNDMMALIETISDSKQIIKRCKEREQEREQEQNRRENMNRLSSLNNVMIIFDTFGDMYINKIKPLVVALINTLESNYTVIIDTNSERIMTNILMIDLDKDFVGSSNIKVINSQNVSDDLIDVIKYDLALNPYYIKTGDDHNDNETLHMIDRKTLYSIYRSKVHPFTREIIDRDQIDEFNNLPRIKQLRDAVLEKIDLL